MKRITTLLSLALLLLLAGAVLASGSPVIERYVVGGGGGHAEVSPYILDGTIGQAVVGLDSHAPYQLCSGFQCRAVSVPGYQTFLPLVLRDYP